MHGGGGGGGSRTTTSSTAQHGMARPARAGDDRGLRGAAAEAFGRAGLASDAPGLTRTGPDVRGDAADFGAAGVGGRTFASFASDRGRAAPRSRPAAAGAGGRGATSRSPRQRVTSLEKLL